jgi:hypothetical protein
MTWLVDAQQGRLPEGPERDKLIAKRLRLVRQLEDLGLRPISKTQAGREFDTQERLAIAKKIVAIDKKLGREVG